MASIASIPARVLVDSMAELADANFLELPDIVVGLIPGWVRTQLERLDELGVITAADEKGTLARPG